MATSLAVFALGCAAILGLAELVVRRTIALARRFRLSGTFVGLTVLSIGTSLPEVVTHVAGSVRILRAPEERAEVSGLLLGANIGSDVFQQLFLLPLFGLLGAITVVRGDLLAKVGALVAATALLLALCFGDGLSRAEGGVLTVAYLAYLVFLWKRGERGEDVGAGERLGPGGVGGAAATVVLGFVAMGFAADRVVEASTAIVEAWGIGASFFGLLFLGVATALPEALTAGTAWRKGESQLCSSVLIGSNVTNPLFAVGVGALVSGYDVPRVARVYDLPFKLATALLLFVFLRRRADLDRAESIVLLVAYVAWLVARRIWFAEDAPSPA